MSIESPKEFLMPKTFEEDQSDRRKLQREMFAVCDENNPEKIKAVKQKFETEYPDQLEGVNALFGFVDCLNNMYKLESQRIPHQERLKIIEELTQYHFLLSHFIKENTNDREFLQLFWDALYKIASPGFTTEFNIYRAGVLTNVATYKIFERLGDHPKMSNPKDDAFNSIDMWVGEDVVQIKGDSRADKVEVIEVKNGELVSVPGVIVDKNNQSKYYSPEMLNKIQRFKVKFDEYKKAIGKPEMKAYFLVIPYHLVDKVTGEPSDALIAEVKSKIDQLNEAGG